MPAMVRLTRSDPFQPVGPVRRDARTDTAHSRHQPSTKPSPCLLPFRQTSLTVAGPSVNLAVKNGEIGSRRTLAGTDQCRANPGPKQVRTRVRVGPKMGRNMTWLAQVAVYSTSKRPPVKCRPARAGRSGQRSALRQAQGKQSAPPPPAYSAEVASATKAGRLRRASISHQWSASAPCCCRPPRRVDREAPRRYPTVGVRGATMLIVAVRQSAGACGGLSRAGDWGVRALQDHHAELPFEPPSKDDPWLYLPVAWTPSGED